jgi:DNA-binding MarR family transcriptional regulator
VLDLDDNIAVLHARICQSERRLVSSAFSELGLHAGQERVLFCLIDHESVAQSDLVAHLGVEPPTLTKMLQRMERAGFVERHPDDEDGRATRVRATPAGLALLAPIRQIWGDVEARMTSNMTLTEQTLLRRLLMQALANLSRHPNEA